MIDPSLIVCSRTIDKVFHLVRELSYDKKCKFYLPKTFVYLVREEIAYDKTYFKFFLDKAVPASLNTIRKLIVHYSELITLFEPSFEQKMKHRGFYEILLLRLRYYTESLAQTLFEEWVFLQEYSIIISRIRKTFSKFIDAGGICIQLGEKAFNTLIRKSLKKAAYQQITTVDKIRSVSKWIAMGGPEILMLLNIDMSLSALGSFLSKVFLLLDPSPPSGIASRYFNYSAQSTSLKSL